MELGGARNVLTQLRRGTIEYCVLAVLASGPEYAFEMVRRLSVVDGLVTSEGTIYPLLARLRRDGLVTTTWQESDAGPPRRYYRLTPAGRRALAGFTDEWTRFSDAVDELLVPVRDDRSGTGGHDAAATDRHRVLPHPPTLSGDPCLTSVPWS